MQELHLQEDLVATLVKEDLAATLMHLQTLAATPVHLQTLAATPMVHPQTLAHRQHTQHTQLLCRQLK